jgi:hypothetical protein
MTPALKAALAALIKHIARAALATGSSGVGRHFIG